ncbi:MAG: DUF2975 domain-containing protein [Alphaproteobacteria bacterium]|nr:DUF2975 domain-containing protein [Alphaproteobacteria bacterium]
MIEPSQLHKIQRLSAVMRVLTVAALAVLPVLLAALWLFAPEIFWNTPELQMVRRSDPDLPLGLRVAAAAVTLAAAGPLLFGLDQLRRLFTLYCTGKVFVAEGARRLRAFAWAVILMAVVQPVAGAALTVLLTLDNPPGQRMLSISFGSGEIQTLFVGLLFLVVATIMGEATRIADENAEFV